MLPMLPSQKGLLTGLDIKPQRANVLIFEIKYKHFILEFLPIFLGFIVVLGDYVSRQ